MKNVVIIGGGFAGINLAAGLAGKKDFHVTVVDTNYGGLNNQLPALTSVKKMELLINIYNSMK